MTDLKDLELKAKRLTALRKIQNEILANCSYSNQEMNMQLSRLEKMNTSQEEIFIISKSWEYRQKKGKELLKELEEYLRNQDHQNK